MHHPVSFDPFGCSTFVEDKRLLQADALAPIRRVDWPISSSGFPETCSSYPVRSRAVPRNRTQLRRGRDALMLTWEIPWIILVDIQLPDELNRERLLLDFSFKVEPDELFICWMKSKASAPWCQPARDDMKRAGWVTKKCVSKSKTFSGVICICQF